MLKSLEHTYKSTTNPHPLQQTTTNNTNKLEHLQGLRMFSVTARNAAGLAWRRSSGSNATVMAHNCQHSQAHMHSSTSHSTDVIVRRLGETLGKLGDPVKAYRARGKGVDPTHPSVAKSWAPPTAEALFYKARRSPIERNSKVP